MPSNCGAGKDNAPGFQEGNTCAGEGGGAGEGKPKQRRIDTSSKQRPHFDDARQFTVDGGFLELVKNPKSSTDWSIIELYVDKDKRRTGIATDLIKRAIQEGGTIGGQASNDGSVKLLWELGFRLGGKPDGTLEDALGLRKEYTSVLLVYDTNSNKTAQTTSKEFKSWFGDSKIVDKNGEPMVVYHGSPNPDFNELSYEHIGKGLDQWGLGFYMGETAEIANRHTSKHNVSGQEKKHGGVLPLYAKIKNPLVLDGLKDKNFGSALELTYDQALHIIKQSPNIHRKNYNPLEDWGYDVSGGVEDWMLKEVADSYTNPMHIWNDFFKRQNIEGKHAEIYLNALSETTGYDGVQVDFGTDKSSYIAWFPNQIKSAIGNKGDFDPENPKITHAKSDCGAGKEGSAGFQPGNTCAGEGGGKQTTRLETKLKSLGKQKFPDISYEEFESRYLLHGTSLSHHNDQEDLIKLNPQTGEATDSAYGDYDDLEELLFFRKPEHLEMFDIMDFASKHRNVLDGDYDNQFILLVDTSKYKKYSDTRFYKDDGYNGTSSEIGWSEKDKKLKSTGASSDSSPISVESNDVWTKDSVEIDYAISAKELAEYYGTDDINGKDIYDFIHNRTYNPKYGEGRKLDQNQSSLFKREFARDKDIQEEFDFMFDEFRIDFDFESAPNLRALADLEGRVPMLRMQVEQMERIANNMAMEIVSTERLNILPYLQKTSHAIKSALRNAFWVSDVDHATVVNLQKLLADAIRGVMPDKSLSLPEFIDSSKLEGAVNLTDARLETIYRTNIMTSANEGVMSVLRSDEGQDAFPLVMITEIVDDRSRPHHAVMDGYITTPGEMDRQNLRPPNGYNCRATLIKIDWDSANDMGLLDEYGNPDMIAINKKNTPEQQGLIKAGIYPDEGFKRGNFI